MHIDFYPNAKRAEILAQSMQTSLTESLNYLFSLIEEVISENKLTKAKEVIENIKQCKRIPGYAYALNQQLLSAIEQQDINAVHETIEFLLTLKLHHNKDVAIINFSPLVLGEKLYELGNEAFEDDTNKIDIPPCSDDAFKVAKNDIANILKIISKIDNEICGEINHFVNELWLFSLPYNTSQFSFSSATAFKFFGTVLFNIELKYPSIICHIDKLVHETTHLYLLSLPERDTLVLNEPKRSYASPIRKDLRTMVGVYHATIVLARILYAFQKIMEKEIQELKNEFNLFDTLAPEYTNKFYEGLNVIRQHAKLGETGKLLIDQAEDYVSNISVPHN